MDEMCSVSDCTDPPVNSRGWCSGHYYRWARYGDPLEGRNRRGSAPAFIELAVSHEGDDCLPWPYAQTTTGYGRYAVAGKIMRAHRVVLERVAGPPPTPQHHAAHAPLVCHNRLCVNPRHLRWATRTENMADTVIDGTQAQGERGPGARLTESQVKAIRGDSRTYREIQREYGISIGHISMIKSRKVWAGLPD